MFAIREPLTRIADPGPDGSVIGHNEKGESTSSHLGAIGQLRLYAIVELRSRGLKQVYRSIFWPFFLEMKNPTIIIGDLYYNYIL